MTTEQKVTRKLRAILSADVKGYSLLMTNDEASTIKTLKEYRIVMSEIIKQHSGRVVDALGDNMLAEFSSVVNAVQCSVEIQNELKIRNAKLSDDRRLVFRIGVNIGDVVQDGDSLYGEGVNIAARIEGLADPGGVCISRNAYDHIRNKLGFGYEYLGDHNVKNIKQPVRVYKVLMAQEDSGKLIGEKPGSASAKWIFSTIAVAFVALSLVSYLLYQKLSAPEFEPASIEKMAFPLPEKPSIAVLPFDNLSGDQSQKYIADGLSESIISSLSKIPDMLVIARNSTFVYKGKAVKVNQVAEELGVRYVLEGSIQKSGDNMRVTAQLVDAVEGHHLWSETYDRNTKDFFAVQDDITRNIVIALQVELTEGEQALIWHSTENLKAWGYATRGIALMQFYTKGKNAKARELFKKAVALDPNYAFAWISIAWTHGIDSRFGFSESREESFKQCIKFTEKTAKLNESMPEIHSTWNFIYLLQKEYDKAITEGKKAVALVPSDATSHMLLSLTMHFAGRFKEAIFHIKEAMRLDPFYPTSHLYMLGNSYCMAKEYENAVIVLEKAMEKSKKEGNQRTNNYTRLIQAFVESGQIGKAKQHALELLKLNPNFSLENWQKSQPYKNPADLERLLNALHKAGLPEVLPLPLPDKPSIAVLPFKNISGEPGQEFLADGITESIISAISRASALFVIASNSVFTYKGKAVRIQTISHELGVKYVLEGTVQKAGNRLRINVQLVNAIKGRHLWSEKYDREMQDLFFIQDSISKEVLTALQVKLVKGEQARVWAKSTENLDAYIKFLQAYDHFRSFSKSNMIITRQKCEEAIAIDPSYEFPHSLLGVTHLIDLWYSWGESSKVSIEKAITSLEKGLALNPKSDFALASISHLYLLQKRFDEAVLAGEKSMVLNPNGELGMVLLGITFNFVRRYEEAINLFKEAQRRNPYCPAWYIHNAAISYLYLKKWDEAITECKRALKRNPDHYPALRILASVYGLSGQLDKGRAVMAKILKIDPNFIPDRAMTSPNKYKSDVELIRDGLRKVMPPEK